MSGGYVLVDEQKARLVALDHAVRVAALSGRTLTAEQIVQTAESFRAFLAGEATS